VGEEKEMKRIFIGYDAKEAVAWHVCADSILRHASEPVCLIPLHLPQIHGYAEDHKDGSNEFVYSRFLVPLLCGFNGWALYMDSDMVVKHDICQLWGEVAWDQAAAVVKHDYQTKHPQKYLGAKNEDYPRKNWSSLIMWNCGHYANRRLGRDFVRNTPGSFLHRFEWIPEDKLGELAKEWNWLVGEYPPNPDARVLHYTLGVPSFKQYRSCDHAEDYWGAHMLANFCEQWE